MKTKFQEKEIISLYSKWLEQMDLIQEKTGINGYFVIGGLLLSIVTVSLGYFENLITNLVGTLYPAFWTMKSIESKGDDDKQWLTYWVVFASFTIVDVFSGFILKFIPFYFFFKIIFLIWLFMPNSMGCNLVYHLLVVRVFKSFEQDIDQAADKVAEYTKELTNMGSGVIEKATDTINIANVIVTESSDVGAAPKTLKPKKSNEEKEKNPFSRKKMY